ncbi:MAG TPA: phosphodiester glycosidase family protein [Streptosporangiaceae bacterium]
MRAAGKALAALGAAGALTLSVFSGGTAAASADRGAGAQAAAGTSGSVPSRGWVPSTPEYWPQVVGEQKTEPVTITHGVQEYTENYQTVSGAQHAQIMDIDLTDPNIHFGMVEAGDKIVDPSDEVISSMASRTGAVAGVNSDEFAINTTGQPMGMVVQNGVLQASPVASWPAEVEVLNNGQFEFTTETFSGTADDTTTGSSDPLAALNRIDQNNLTAVTPYLGAATIGASTIASLTVNGDGSLTVNSVTTSQTALPQVPQGQEDLVARRGTQASIWLQGLHASDNVTLSDSVAPYGIGSDPTDVQTAVSGAAFLVQNGQMAVPVTGGGENNVDYPVVGIGTTRDGKHAVAVVFNGRESESVAVGLTRPQQAQWFIAHGIYNAIEFDSGGSAEMVARLPGDQKVSVLNTPSDGAERPVANGLFIYTNQATPTAATKTVVNEGKPYAMLSGTTEPVSAYALDAEDNPASDAVSLSVQPHSLASVSGTSLTAGSHPGSGSLIVTAGHATSRVPLTVTSSPASLSLSPSAPDLANSATQQFAVTGTARTGALALGSQDVTWSVSPAALGAISSTGLFTAAASGSGLATVTATAGGVGASASVAVGSDSVVLDPMTDLSNWTLSTLSSTGSPPTATSSESTSQLAQPGDTGSMDVHYTIPKASGVSQIVVNPAAHYSVTLGENGAGEEPTAIGVWIKGIGGSLGTPLANGELTFAEAWLQVNGEDDVFYPTTVTYDGWQLITAQLPAGTAFPLTLNFLDFLVINPSSTTSGDLYVADVEGLYSPRTPAPYAYTAVPKNPAWLQYDESPAQFEKGGVTVAAFGDSHLGSADENSTGAVVTGDIGSDLAALPAAARPNMVQVDGNLVDPGSVGDLDYAQTLLNSFGVPYHTAVGDSDIGQGANPESGNWTSVFGPTHYSYTDGPAEFVVTDSAWEGLTESDPYQVPSEEQYAWLVSTLNASTAKDIVVVTHASPYDPQPLQNSQFSDRYEAQMYEQLLANYQASHPWTHVILLSGQARGYYEQVINPEGTVDPHGLPNFDVSDAGVPPYATTSQGGFFNYVLFHFLADGTVQFAVQPVLTSIALTAPDVSLTPRTSEQLTATGTTPAGDNVAALQVPIADPASHEWTSSNPRVASVDPQTGKVTAVSPGTATISVESGGVTGTVTVAVTS